MDNKILIEPIVDKTPHGYAIQAKKYSLDLKITNKSNTPSEEFTIDSITILSAENQNIRDNFDGKKFFVPIINPEESIVLHIGENGQFMHGLISIQAIIKPKKDGVYINFMQNNPFTNQMSSIVQKNTWVDFLYIKNSNNFLQEITNRRLLQLTWALFIIGIISIVPTVIKIYDFYLTITNK